MYGQPQGYPQPGQPGYYPPQGYPQPGQPGFGPQPGQPGYYPPQQAQGYPPQQQGYPPQTMNFGVATVTTTPAYGGAYGVSVPVGQPVSIQFPNGRYFCAEPSGNFAVDRTQVGEWEKFRIESVGPNLYAFRSAHNKVVCWNNGNNRFENRDAVGDWERFELRPAGPNQYFLFNPNQQVFITFDQMFPRAVRGQHEAQPVTIAAPGGQAYPAQQAYGGQPSYGLVSGQQVSFRFLNGRYFCAEPSGNFAVDRTQVGEWEKFRVESVGPNLYAFRTAHNKVVCWNNGNNRFENRDAVGDWERFEVRPAGPGQYFLFNPNQQVFITFDQMFPRAVRGQHEAQPIHIQ